MSVLQDSPGRHRSGDGVPVNDVLARFGMSTPVTTAATSWPVHVPSSRLVVGPRPDEDVDPVPRRSPGRVPATILAAVVGLGIPGAMLATEGFSDNASISALGFSESAEGDSQSPPVYSGTAKPRDLAAQVPGQTGNGKTAQPRLPTTIAGAATGNVLDGQNPWEGRRPAVRVETPGAVQTPAVGSASAPVTQARTVADPVSRPVTSTESSSTTPRSATSEPGATTPAPSTPTSQPESTSGGSGNKQLCLLFLCVGG